MASKKQPVKDQPVTPQEESGRGPLLVDVCGIAMYLPDLKRIVVVDARKARVSVTDGSMIAPHMPIVGIVADSYEPLDDTEETKTIGKVSFDYDIDGDGTPLRFDAFLLDGHFVKFKGVEESRPSIGGGKPFGSIKMLAPDLELCTGVKNGTSRQVIGTVDFSNAFKIEGTGHGKHAGPLMFGQKVLDCADMVGAQFKVGKGQPVIEMQAPGEKPITITLRGDGPWRVMVGNFPIEEIVGLQPTEVKHDVPLTHLELYYDLYHVGRNTPLPVPRGDNHIHAAMRTATGRCGPTLVPDDEPLKTARAK